MNKIRQIVAFIRAGILVALAIALIMACFLVGMSFILHCFWIAIRIGWDLI